MLTESTQRASDGVGDGPGRPAQDGAGTSTLTWAAALLGPLILLVIYRLVVFKALTNSDAMDFAQIGRNLGAGHGFSTLILRPLAIHGADALRQPDLTHGPLYPVCLAIAFALFGAKDAVASSVSGLFYVLTVPLIYLLGGRLFSARVGALAATVFAVNSYVLDYAISGTHITLCLFLATALFLVFHGVASAVRSPEGGAAQTVPTGKLLLCGALAGLLYLADPMFAWLLPVLLVAVLALHDTRRTQYGLWFLLGVVVIAGPWMLRNLMVAGNPVFGLRGREVWMNTTIYPGYVAYRMLPDDVVPGQLLIRSVVKKVLVGGAQVLQTFPQAPMAWMLAFLLPSLFFRMRNPEASATRRAALWSLAALMAGGLLFSLQITFFLVLAPVLVVFACAYLLYIAGQAQLSKGSTRLAVALIAFVVAYPLLAQMALGERPEAVKEMVSAQALVGQSQPTDVVLSDVPWVVAWYADRPSLWLPADDRRLPDLRKLFPGNQYVLITEQSRAFSQGWQWVYSILQQQNDRYASLKDKSQAGSGSVRLDASRVPKELVEKLPLVTELNGLTWLKPAEGAARSTVVAALPPAVAARPAGG